MNNKRYAYGWKPDIPDQRDFLYSAIRPVIRVPKTVDLRETCSKIENQGRLGSCTAQALAGNLEFQAESDAQDEIGNLSRALDAVVKDLKKARISIDTCA